MKKTTCFENPSKPSTIEFFLNNCPKTPSSLGYLKALDLILIKLLLQLQILNLRRKLPIFLSQV